MRTSMRFRPVVLSAALAAFALLACTDTSGDETTAPRLGGPSFAPGSNAGANLDQWANGKTPPTAESWQNGNLNGNNSAYAEGRAVPFRLAIEGLTAGEHFITIQYDFTAGGHKAYDFLASIQATEPHALEQICAVGGGGVSSLCVNGAMPAAPDLEPFPGDIFADAGHKVDDAIANDPLPRFLTIFGGTILEISAVTHAGTVTGNSTGQMVVRFSTTGSAVLLAWSGHLARSSFWNSPTDPDGAGEVSGAPWHMRTLNLDGGGAANQDRSIQPSALVENPTLAITKTANPAGPVSAGSNIAFDITVTNNGPGAASGVTVTDTLPAGFSWTENSGSCAIGDGALGEKILTCTVGDLAASANFAVTVTSPTDAADCAVVSNRAWADAGNADPVSDDASVTILCGALVITKTANPVGPVSAGTNIGFDLEVKNNGPGAVSGVTVTDTLPAGFSWTENSGSCAIGDGALGEKILTCTVGDLADDATFTVTITSPTDPADCKEVTNKAWADASNTDPVSDDASVTVLCPGLAITKTANPVGPVSAGTNIGFDLEVKNNGPGAASGVTVTDTLPAGFVWTENSTSCAIGDGALGEKILTCTVGDLADDATFTVTVTTPTDAADCAVVSNRAWADAGNDDPVSDDASVTILCPDLAITKTPNPVGPVTVGNNIGFVIEVKNNGPGAASGVTVTDTLPAGFSWTENSGSCAIGDGALGEKILSCTVATLADDATFTVTVTTPTVAANCAVISNVAWADATNDDPVSDDGSVTVVCPPNLQITKTPDQEGDAGYSVSPGGTATFTITVKNTGSGAATNVVVLDTLPAGLDWNETNGSCVLTPITNVDDESTELLTCTIASLAGGGAEFSVSVSATVPADFIQDDPSDPGDPIEIDGNLADGAAAGKDWATVGIICQTVGCRLDQPTGTTDNSFGQGTKEDSPVPTIVAGSIPNNKSDLLRFYVANERFVTTDFLYLAWERVQAPNGTTNMDFELNQSTTLSANGVTSVRTAGDILIKYDLAKGGTNPTLGFHRWVTAASAGGQTAGQACEAANSFPCWGKLTSLIGDPHVAAAINTVSVADPINPGAPRMLDALTFGEASIDLRGTGIFMPGACVSFGRAYLKSRSSDSFTSEIKDFIEPIPISVSNCQPRLIPNEAWVSASNFAPSGGNLGDGISDTGEIQVTVPNGSASLFTAPAGRELAEVDASVTLTTSVVAADMEAFEPSSLGTRSVAARQAATNSWSLTAVSEAGASAEGVLAKSIARTRRMG